MFSSLKSAVSRLLFVQDIDSNAPGTQEHDLVRLLDQFVNVGGAGTWPPQNAFGDAWPAPLRPYHQIFMERSSTLCVEHPSLDDEFNKKQIELFRSEMRDALSKIDMDAVTAVLESVENDEDAHSSMMSTECYNGFFACIVHLRQAYRWGIIPVVKAAQDDRVINFPTQLSTPWSFIRRRFGITSLAGCAMAMFYCNVDERELPVYQATHHMPLKYRETEKRFCDILWQMEKASFPVYKGFVQSLVYFDKGMRRQCLDTLVATNSLLAVPLKIFGDSLTKSKIDYSLWMGYVQGFEGFGAGEFVDGNFVEYDGLAGNQSAFILIIDAYLGMRPYLSQEAELQTIPVFQRNLLNGLRRYNFPARVKESGDAEMLALLDKMMVQMKTFRKNHLFRMRPYLDVDRPERKIMTAGRGVMDNDDVPNTNAAAIGLLEDILRKRIQESVV